MSIVNTSEWIEERRAILATSDESSELGIAATQLAASDDPAALDALAPFLSDSGFLARLDDVNDPGVKTLNLGQVLMTLQSLPSPEIVPLCLRLNRDPVFLSDPDRKTFLLEALAAVIPMSSATAQAFREANQEGYYSAAARMLAANASPNAMSLLLEMMLDPEVDAQRKVGALHMSLIPVRNRLAVLEFTGRLASRKPDPAVTQAAIESIYDFQTRWRKGHPPPPPAWRTSPNDVLKALVNLAAYLKSHVPVQEPLLAAIDRTTRIAQALLERREQ